MNNHFIINTHIKSFAQSIDIKDSSKITYVSQLKSFGRWLRHQEISKPNEQTIDNYIAYLKREKNFSDLSINSYLATIKLFFSWLSVNNIYSNVPLKMHKLHIDRTKRKKCITQQQAKKLLRAINRSTLEGKRDFALINLMIWSGLRSRQIMMALKGDIADCCGSRLLWLQKKGENGKNQHISLSNKLFGFIQEYLITRKSVNDSEPLFASHSSKNFGQPLTLRSISRIIKKRLKIAKINDSRITPVCLRNTALLLNLLTRTKQRQNQ